MTKQSSTQKEEAIRKLNLSVFESLLRGKKKSELVRELVKNGWEKQKANKYLNNIVEHFPKWKENMTDHYKTKMMRGLAIFAIGIIITGGSYIATFTQGGSYIITYGAVIFGFLDFLGGLLGWLKYKKDVEI